MNIERSGEYNDSVEKLPETIPHVSFEIAPVEETIPILHRFLNPREGRSDWSHFIYKQYPDLKDLLDDVDEREKREKIENKFFSDYFDREKEKIQAKAELFQKEWDKINTPVMETLSNIMEQEWSLDDKEISARASVNPICPRWIKRRMFDVFYMKDIDGMKATTIHESSHFIYFDKWQAVFPETEENEYDQPHLAWHLSEMVPGVILNDERMKAVFEYDHKSYSEYYELMIEGKSVISHLQGFYDGREDFEDFLRKSWDFVNKNKKG